MRHLHSHARQRWGQALDDERLDRGRGRVRDQKIERGAGGCEGGVGGGDEEEGGLLMFVWTDVYVRWEEVCDVLISVCTDQYVHTCTHTCTHAHTHRHTHTSGPGPALRTKP